MTVKLIIDNDAVRARMSLEDRQEINDAIDSSLIAAHVFLAGQLNTAFDPNPSLQDIFYLNREMFPDLPGDMFRCRLKQAFVKSIANVQVAETRRGLFIDAEVTTVPSTDYQVDMEKGLVYIECDGYEHNFLMVSYAAGFDSVNKAPDWLQECALSYVPSILNYQQVTNRNAETEKAVRMIQSQVAGMMDNKRRETAFQLSPIY